MSYLFFDEAELCQLEAFLAARIHDAQAVSAKSIKQVFEETRVAVAKKPGWPGHSIG